MRLLINASVIRSEGGVTLLEAILEAFRKVMPKDSEVVLYLNSELADRFKDAREGLKIIPFRPSGWLLRFVWEQFILPMDCLKYRADMLFSFANTGPLVSLCPQVLYVQQSIPYTNFLPKQNKTRWCLFALTYGFLMALAQLGSQKIIVPTSWLIKPMRHSVCNLVPELNYHVSPPGLPVLNEEGELSERERELIARINICRAAGHKIIFYPAYLAPYKHIPYLLESIEQLRKNDISFRLLLTFDRESPEYFPCRDEVFNTYDRLGLTDQEVIFCGHLSRAAVSRLYGLSDALAFPSQVETLGLPLMEALAVGVPVVACDTPFAREICGDAALYADSSDPSAFSSQLKRVLCDEKTRKALLESGAARRGNFSWEKHARDILGL